MPATTAFFNRRTRAPDGLQVWCKGCLNGRKRDHSRYVGKYLDQQRTYMLRHRYGLTPADVTAMIQMQEGRCGICSREMGTRPHIDHDHLTGRVRGILCPRCNLALGFIEALGVEQLREYLCRPSNVPQLTSRLKQPGWSVADRKRALLYGLSPEAFSELMESQEARCGLCRNLFEEKPRAFDIDHDHRSGRVRAILCRTCNNAAGRAESIGLDLINDYLSRTAY